MTFFKRVVTLRKVGVARLGGLVKLVGKDVSYPPNNKQKENNFIHFFFSNLDSRLVATIRSAM